MHIQTVNNYSPSLIHFLYPQKSAFVSSCLFIGKGEKKNPGMTMQNQWKTSWGLRDRTFNIEMKS